MSKIPPRGLGRGLEALIGLPEGGGAGTEMIAVDQIAPSAEQVRGRFDSEPLRDLAESIRAHGVLQPVLVRRRPQGYELIAGERRWRAARMAGLERIPAIVRGPGAEEEAEKSEALLLGLIENLQRADLDPIEEARGVRRLVDRFGLTHEEAARRLGKHRVTVTQALSLLTAAPAVISATSGGAISAGHARVLAALPDRAAQEQGLKVILARGLSVRQTEHWARDAKQKVLRQPPGPNLELEELGTLLAEKLGLNVSVRGSANRGRVILEWSSPAELAELRARLL